MTEYAAGKYTITGPATYAAGAQSHKFEQGAVVDIERTRRPDSDGDVLVRRADGISGYLRASSLTPYVEPSSDADADTVAVLAVIEALGFLDVDEDTVSKAITLARLIEKGV